jgi:hypothetical protein
VASCANTTTFGGFVGLQNLLNSSTAPTIVSISYGDSESELGSAGNAYISALYQQAITEGVSIFVAAGDQGAASSDPGVTNATHGINVSGFTSTPYNVSVGGTDFGDTFAGSNSAYWSSANTSTYGSAKSYVPEIPWNNSCASSLITSYFGFATTYGAAGFCNSATGTANFLTTAAGSGGPSACASGAPTIGGVVGGTCSGYSKPGWQSVIGNPNDGVRDIPDVSLFTANGVWGHYYVVCFSDTTNGGTPCTGTPNTWSGFGGTSISSPIMAAVQALINQTVGSSSGNPNPTLYSLAVAEYGTNGNTSCNSSLGNSVSSTCIFYDITLGDISIDCRRAHNCYLPSGTYGVLSESNSSYQPAYETNTGWDFATGIGTVNVTNLVNNWPKAPSITSTANITFTVGSQGAFTVTATGVPTPTLAELGALPGGVTFNAMTGLLSGTPAAGTAGTYTISFTASNGVGINALQNFVLTVNSTGSGSAAVATATFLSEDTSTEGNWQGVYGADGTALANVTPQNIPSYATFQVQNQGNYTWASNPSDPRALETGSGTARIAACWYSPATFSFNVNFTDGNAHQFALYAVDWDNSGRADTVQIVDANTGNQLDLRTLSNFSSGAYLVWNISGHVIINVTSAGGTNAVVNGVFFN